MIFRILCHEKKNAVSLWRYSTLSKNKLWALSHKCQHLQKKKIDVSFSILSKEFKNSFTILVGQVELLILNSLKYNLRIAWPYKISMPFHFSKKKVLIIWDRAQNMLMFGWGAIPHQGAPSILVNNFLVKSQTKSPISNPQFFCFKSLKCAVYFSCDKYFKSAIATELNSTFWSLETE